VLLAALAAWSFLRPPANPNPSVTRFELTLPLGYELVGAGPVAISPAGDRVAYVAGRSTGADGMAGTIPGQLFIRSLDAFEAQPIAGTEGAAHPFFSPDGEWVGFYADGRLQRVAVAGGAPVTITDVPGYFDGGSWGEDDTIVFGSRGMQKVPARGGTPETIVSMDDAGVALTWPQILSGGKHVLFTAFGGGEQLEDRVRIGVLSLETGEWKIVLPGATGARFVESGHLL
jgi:serine/threonine-protein kinase